jgi:O-antigen/teichoic acid export membrane protein
VTNGGGALDRRGAPLASAEMADQSSSARGPVATDLLDTPHAGPAAVRGGIVRVGGYALGVLLTVVSAALLFRHLGVVDTGRYVTVLALASLVAGVTDIGLTTIGMRELSVRDGPSRDQLMRNLLGVRLVLTLAGVGGAVLFGLAAGYDPDMVAGTALAGIAVVGVAVQSTLGISLMVRLRLGLVTGLELLRQAVLVAGIVALVAIGAGLLPFFAIQIPAALAALAATILLVRHTVPVVPAFDRTEWVELVRSVLPFAAATIIAAVYFRAALIVLEIVSTPRETGWFAASFRVTEVLLLVPNLVVGSAFPIFARAARDDRLRLGYGLGRVFQSSLVLGSCCMVALVLGAPFVIDVIAGQGFEPSVDVLRVQAIALLISFAATPLTYAMLSLKLHRAILALSSTALAANLAFVAILGSTEGALGAAAGTVGAEVVGFSVAWIVLRRRVPEVAPKAATALRVAPAVAAGLAIGLVPGLPAVVAAVVGSAVFTGVAFTTGAVPEELLGALRSRARGAAR